MQKTEDKEAKTREAFFSGETRNTASPLDVPLKAWKKWSADQGVFVHEEGTYVGLPKGV